MIFLQRRAIRLEVSFHVEQLVVLIVAVGALLRYFGPSVFQPVYMSARRRKIYIISKQIKCVKGYRNDNEPLLCLSD